MKINKRFVKIIILGWGVGGFKWRFIHGRNNHIRCGAVQD